MWRGWKTSKVITNRTVTVKRATKGAICFATLPQNEMESDVARFTARSVGGHTRNITIQQCCQQAVPSCCPFYRSFKIYDRFTKAKCKFSLPSQKPLLMISHGTKFLRNFSRRLVSIWVKDNTRIIITKKRNSQSEPLQLVCYTIQIYRSAESDLKTGRKCWC